MYLQLVAGLLCARNKEIGTRGKMVPSRYCRVFLDVWEWSYETLQHPFNYEISGSKGHSNVCWHEDAKKACACHCPILDVFLHSDVLVP